MSGKYDFGTKCIAQRCVVLILSIIVGLSFWGCKERELGVYTLCSYEDSWKGQVCLSPAYDPYEDFWTLMNAGSGAPYADANGSQRYHNEEVNILTVLPIPDDEFKGWDEFDLVFFYGHNNMIVPPHPHDLFKYYTYSGGAWTDHIDYLDEIGWGHTTPYDYYTYSGVTTGDTHPGSVTYLYYKYTSCLLGGLYHYGPGTGYHWRLHWDDPVQTTSYGQLGSKDLEWLILHGCQAVITANEDGSYNPMGFNCFRYTHGKFHIVLGHYKSYFVSQLQPLAQFALDLMNGVPVQPAYFDIDPAFNSSAIAAEEHSFTGWANSTMANDRWTKPMSDHKGTCYFTQRWVKQLISIDTYWD